MRLDLRGAQGDLRASYQPALTFGVWRLRGDTDTGCELTSRAIERCDAFLASALTLNVPVGNTVWKFKVEHVNVDDATSALTVHTRGMPVMSPL